MKKIIALFVLIAMMTLCLASCSVMKYNDAISLIDAGKYEEAYELLKELGDYKDAKQLLAGFHYVPSSATFEQDGEKLSVEFFYNENNLPLRTILTNKDGKQHSSDYTYDKNNDLTKEFFIDFEIGETTYTYTYDENRNLIKSVYDHASGTYYTVENAYDSNKNIISSSTTYSDGYTSNYENSYETKCFS